MSTPLKIAVFDLTDCEGCELQFLALRQKLVKNSRDFLIANWRLVSPHQNPGPFDVTFIEGSPITESDIEIVKQARRFSEKIVTLGACADLGGVQSLLPQENRAKALADVYGSSYEPKTRAPKPVSYYIEVDIHLPGCPVNPQELEGLLSCLVERKEFKSYTNSVCLECKARGNACLFLDEGFCLGPVTRGGCGAPCPSNGLRCYGCFGPMPGANLAALENATKHLDPKERERALNLFWTHSDVLKNHKTRPKRKQGPQTF